MSFFNANSGKTSMINSGPHPPISPRLTIHCAWWFWYLPNSSLARLCMYTEGFIPQKSNDISVHLACKHWLIDLLLPIYQISHGCSIHIDAWSAMRPATSISNIGIILSFTILIIVSMAKSLSVSSSLHSNAVSMFSPETQSWCFLTSLLWTFNFTKEFTTCWGLF